jgi:hypothetical protein
MLNQNEFMAKVGALQGEVRGLTDIDDPSVISATAADLKRLNYTPPVSIPLDTFLAYTTSDLLAEIGRIVDLPEAEVPELPGQDELSPMEIKLEHIAILVFYFKELADLRRQVPEAWDEVDELYVHD